MEIMSRTRNTIGQGCRGRLAALTLGLGLLGVTGLAQAMDLWVGVGAGQTKFDPTRLGAPSLVGDLDDTDTGHKFMFGGPMFENFALEFSILKLGSFSASGAGGASMKNEAKGWAVEGIGMFPLGKSFALLARYGLFRHDFDTACSNVAGSCGNASVLDATYGAGVQYGMTKGINLRAEWQRFEGLGDQQSSEGDIDMLSIGVLYWF
jgi:hypothetical protein